jgi:polysaccharide biosynthesis/export protein
MFSRRLLRTGAAWMQIPVGNIEPVSSFGWDQNMATLLTPCLKKRAVLALLPWLAACAMAPGQHVDALSSDVGPSGQKPQIIPITHQLVQKERELTEQQANMEVTRLVAAPSPYAIDAGDILSIVVWDHPELASAAMVQTAAVNGADSTGTTLPPAGFTVDHEGLVQFPFVGKMKLAGLTEGEARKQLATMLSRYIRNPDVTLRVQAYRSKRIYVDGEVKTPGTQTINDIPMTLTEALNRAGGLLPTGDQSRIAVTRAGTTYHVNLPQLVKKGVNPGSIMLANGDSVQVGSRDDSKVFVTGEVVRPSALTMRNGRLTLNEALGEAGGINPLTSDGQQVYVVRNATDAEPKVFHLDARSPVAMALAQNFELQPKDVVYVDATKLALWNRVISLIIPGAANTVVQAVK